MSGAEPDIRGVRIERSGGFAGLAVGTDVDPAALTAAQRKALDQVLRAPPGTAGAKPAARGADRFRYRVRVTLSDGRERTVELSEDDLPAALQALVRPGLP